MAELSSGLKQLCVQNSVGKIALSDCLCPWEKKKKKLLE